MAPSRKRKAAAAAAARRHWKVGDLVLAKLKGFPAWPAMISEPEKWGFNADRKKVLVLFFGTQQIAFCNPVDIEAFTEEKKQSLLKRQGRGADFVRAVKEIVDSYEKSKKQDEVYGSNSSYEDAIPDGGNSAESAAHIEVKEAAETSEVTVTGKTLSSCFAKRRSVALEPSKQVKQRSELVIDKSSISSCSESLKCLKTSLKDSSKCPGNVPTDVVQNGCLRRSRHSRKSPNTSECDDVDSSGFVMTGSTDENDSEIFPSDSASFSLNDGYTIDSDCKPDCFEAPIESWDGDVDSKGLDFQIKAVVVKKKRKLGRKRPTNEATELLGRLERDMELVVGPNNSANVAETACQTLDETYNKDDGDKHLPLVKRARVRMSKLSSCEEHDIPSQDELTCKEVAVNMQDHQYNSCEEEERTNIEASVFNLEATNPSAISQDDCPAFKSSFSPREVSPLSASVSSPDDTKILRTKESEAFGCSADGEAALPPSKRLHRALEAMSANVAKDGEACKSLTKKASISDCSVFPMTSPSNVGTKNEDIYGSGEKKYDGDKVSTFCSSSDVVLKDSFAPVELDACNQAMEGEEHCCYVSLDTVENNGGNELSEPCLKAQVVCASRDLIQGDVTPELDGRQTNLPADLDSSDQSLQMDEKKHTSTFSTDLTDENVCREVDLSELTGTTPSLVSRRCEAVKDVSDRGINLLECIQVDSGLPNAECSRFQIGDSRQTNGEFDSMTENRIERRHKDASHVSFSDCHVADKDALAFQSTLLPADAVESPRRTSPTTASLCQVSTSESANDVHNSGGSSPSAHLNYKKSVCSSLTDEEKTESTIPQLPKYGGKWGNFTEMRTALASFEAVLGSLTRTKESIARATRIAVDCAKFGASAEVIEILARNLEKESTLHKRIDLFFLVDSIAQCSRGSRGDIGGMYPSAIQSALPRLLSAAAPPGSGAHENRRQCLKVLRLWLERKILPESVIRQHIRELDALGGSSSAGPYARRSARRERALDDPIRDMEGMLVDEYGSNSSLQLAGLCMPRMLKDEEEEEEEEKGDLDSDGDGFEAVTPEHNSGSPQDQETSLATEKHTHLLEDVDGELEMEDAAPSEVQIRSTSGSTGVSATQNLYSQSGQSFSLPFVPLMPQEMPPPSQSPPPPPPPLPPLPPPPPLPPTAPASCLVSSSYANGLDVRPYPVSQNAHEDFRPSGVHISDPPKIHQCMSNAEQYHASECRDRMQMQLCDSTGSSSGSYASSQDYGVEHFGGPRFHHEAHHPRLPHPPPSDHFAYMQPRLYGKSRRDTPPHPYSRRSLHNSDGGSFYSSHERMRPAPYEFEEGWRHHMPHFHGPHYQDNKPFHPPGPYRGHSREPVRFPRQVWEDSPRGMHHRDFPPFRPSSEAQCIWRPR